MRDRLWLVRNGVPFNVAFGVPPGEQYVLVEADVASFAIIFSEFEGNKFDINTMQFKERE